MILKKLPYTWRVHTVDIDMHSSVIMWRWSRVIVSPLLALAPLFKPTVFVVLQALFTTIIWCWIQINTTPCGPFAVQKTCCCPLLGGSTERILNAADFPRKLAIAVLVQMFLRPLQYEASEHVPCNTFYQMLFIFCVPPLRMTHKKAWRMNSLCQSRTCLLSNKIQ